MQFWKVIEECCYRLFSLAFRLTGKKLEKNTFSALMQFIRFGIVGVSNTLVSYVVYVLSLILFRELNLFQRIDYFAAHFVEYVLSVLWAFYWNNKLVFLLQEGEKRSLVKSLIKTYISYSFTGLILNNIFLYIWIERIGISEFIAPLINLVVSVPLNFLINKFWAFRSE